MGASSNWLSVECCANTEPGVHIVTVLSLISSIPNVVWSGMLASFITLAGVMLSNWDSRRRLMRQLDHDAAEKRKDRNAGLRRDVYLRAAEEFVRASHRLGSLSQVDPVKTNMADNFQDLFVVAAKLQLISSAATSRLVGELSVTYGEILLNIMHEIQPVHDIQTDITVATDAYERSSAEAKRVLSALTSFNESARTESEIFDALQRSFDFNQTQAEKYSVERLSLMDKRSELHLEFSKGLMVTMKRIAEVQAPVMIAIRRELDLDGNIEEFQAQTMENLARMEAALSVAIERMEQWGKKE